MALLVLAALGAQQPVRVACCLPEPALRLVREHLTKITDPTALEPVDPAALCAGEVGYDVVAGLDALACEPLAREGRLLPHAWPPALEPRCVGPDGRFAVPWVAPLALAMVQQTQAGIGAPDDLYALAFDARLDGRIAVCSPEAMPSLWIGLTRLCLRRGHDEDGAFAWLRTLDARGCRYEDSTAAVLGALDAGTAAVAILPAGEIRARQGTLRMVVPASGLLSQGLGVAIAARASDVDAAGRVANALAAPELSQSLASADLLPASRIAPLEMPAAARELAARLPPYEPCPQAERWLARWRETVRGEGQRLGTIELVLDTVFGALFLVFLLFVHRRMSRDPP